MAMLRSKTGAPRLLLHSSDSSDVSPQGPPPVQRSPGPLRPLYDTGTGQHMVSMPEGDPSDLDDKVARLVALIMVEMLPSAKVDRQHHKHDNNSDSQLEDFEESTDMVASDPDPTFGETSRKQKRRHRRASSSEGDVYTRAPRCLAAKKLKTRKSKKRRRHHSSSSSSTSKSSSTESDSDVDRHGGKFAATCSKESKKMRHPKDEKLLIATLMRKAI